MTAAETAKAKLIAGIATLSTAQIEAGVIGMHLAGRYKGRGEAQEAARMVRAYMIEEYITREGAEAGNILMESVDLL
jgi:hypothetical protein